MRGHFSRQNATQRHRKRQRQFLCCMTALVSLLLLPLTGCASQEVTRECFAMDTVMTLSAYGDHAETALTDVETELYRLDRLFSISSSTGDIAKLNRSGSATVSNETAKLLKRALTLSQETEGALDITLYPVSQLWGFYSGDFQVPTSSQIQTALQTVGRNHCHLKGTSVTLDKGTQLDLGAIAKGYASYRAAKLLTDAGVTSANLSLGGNVHVVGTKPDGSNWRVAIIDPNNTSNYAGILQVQDTAVVTSGGYQRNFKKNGKVYHHILDPATGFPAQSGLLSATIISQDDVLADALSTALFVMGPDKAAAYWQGSKDAFEMVLVTEDHRILCSEGIADSFTPTDQYTMEVISR